MVVSKFCPPRLSLYVGLSVFIFYRNFINTSCNFVGCLYGKFFVAQWIYLQLPSASTFIFLLRSPKAELTIDKVSKLGLNSKLIPFSWVGTRSSIYRWIQAAENKEQLRMAVNPRISHLSFMSMSPEIVGSLTKRHCVIKCWGGGVVFPHCDADVTRCPSASCKGGSSHSLKIQCYTCRTWFFLLLFFIKRKSQLMVYTFILPVLCIHTVLVIWAHWL